MAQQRFDPRPTGTRARLRPFPHSVSKLMSRVQTIPSAPVWFRTASTQCGRPPGPRPTVRNGSTGTDKWDPIVLPTTEDTIVSKASNRHFID